jgi:hypothetical protein
MPFEWEGAGGLTAHERSVLEACPSVRLVTIAGHVFFLPNDVPRRIADEIVEAVDQRSGSRRASPEPT